ncbi:hypothetical protein CL660_004980 [bacterium]|nr:hypothetical protein [bacterium]
MMGKKSSLLIDREKVIKSFEFIKEGSKILFSENKNFLIFKKNFLQTIEFIKSGDFILDLNFNSVMQGEFPTLEIKITFQKEKIEIENLSHLINIRNKNEVEDFKNYLDTEIINIVLFCNKTHELELLQINNNFDEIFKNELNNFIN